MPGFDRKRVFGNSEQELDEFTCGICQDILIDPVETQCCRQLYCNECITTWLHENTTCPYDRKQLDVSLLTSPSRIVVNLLMNMKVKCDYHSEGCDVITTMGQLSNHLKACDKNPNKLCQTCGLNREEFDGHNCIQNLMIRNISINDEIKRLTKENQRLSKENEILSKQMYSDIISELTAKSIKQSRSQIEQVVVDTNRGFDANEVQFCIEKSKYAINNFDNFGDISVNLREELYIRYSSRKWHINTLPKGMTCIAVIGEMSILKLNFDKISIVIFYY